MLILDFYALFLGEEKTLSCFTFERKKNLNYSVNAIVKWEFELFKFVLKFEVNS